MMGEWILGVDLLLSGAKFLTCFPGMAMLKEKMRGMAKKHPEISKNKNCRHFILGEILKIHNIHTHKFSYYMLYGAAISQELVLTVME